jgi:hypothetical protein
MNKIEFNNLVEEDIYTTMFTSQSIIGIIWV